MVRSTLWLVGICNIKSLSELVSLVSQVVKITLLQVYNFIAWEYNNGINTFYIKTKENSTILKRDRLIYSHRLFLFRLGSPEPSSGVYTSAGWAALGCWGKGLGGAGTGGGGAMNAPGGGTGGGTMKGLEGGAATGL